MSAQRLGVIGAGAWAVFAHLPAFAARDDVALDIVCRRDRARLETIRDHFGFERATTDWREVIAARPDLVALTGPVHLRVEQARAALMADAHVLLEKPFTTSSAEAWELVRLAEERGRVLMLCYAWNEMGLVEQARRLLLEDGGVGRVEHASVVMSSIVRDLLLDGRPYADLPLDSPPSVATWGEAATSGGGYAQGQLTHALGLLFRLLPSHATDVMAMTASPGGSPVELHDVLALQLDDDVVASVSGAALPWGTYGNTHQLQIRITGDRGQLLLDLDRPLVRRSRGPDDDVMVELSEEDVRWSFERVVDRFVDLAAGRVDENRSPGELGARVVEVIEAMYRSAASGRRTAVVRPADHP